jgi:hypothetical protein
MAEQQKQSLCPRLIDYLAIVGARNMPTHRASGTNNNQPPVQVRVIFLNALERLSEFATALTLMPLSVCSCNHKLSNV